MKPMATSRAAANAPIAGTREAACESRRGAARRANRARLETSTVPSRNVLNVMGNRGGGGGRPDRLDPRIQSPLLGVLAEANVSVVV